MVDDGFDRRSFLKTGSAIAVSVGLSGCSRSSDDSDDAGSRTEPTTTETQPEDQHAELLSVDPGENFSTLPVVDSENRDNTAVVEWGVEDGDGVSQARLFIQGEDTERGIDISQGIQIDERRPDGEKTEGEASFPQQVIPPGSVRFRVEMTDDRGNDYTFRSESYNAGPRKFRTDPKQDFSSYETERGWDNTRFSQQRIDKQRNTWQERAVFDGFIQEVRADNDFKSLGIRYPNYSTAENRYGFFDLEEFKNTENYEEMLRYITAASRAKYHEIEPNSPPSDNSNEIAASAKKAIEEVRGDQVRGWAVFNPGHGTMMFYNPDEDADRRWYHADTTANIIQQPENAQDHRDDIWSPFHSVEADQPGFYQGFSVDEHEGVNTYSQMKRVAVDGIGRMVASGNPLSLSGNKAFITEEWLGDAYSHIREGGKIDPILNPLEEIVDYQVENEQMVGIYGSGLDDTRIAAGEREEMDDLYDEVMVSEGNVSASQIENMLEAQTT